MSVHAVFIGGFQSTQPQVDLWKVSAQQLRNDVTFDAFSYPATKDYSDSGAVHGFGKTGFDAAIQRINDVGADRLFIVGHSSGCAIANELNFRLPKSKSITLVDLDGFVASRHKKQDSDLEPWCAQGDGGKGHSLWWAAEKNKFTSSSATKTWSLHFSLVNLAATDKITHDNYKEIGYAGCVANLCWLTTKQP